MACMSYLQSVGAELTAHLVDTYSHAVGELLMEGNSPCNTHRRRETDMVSLAALHITN